MITYKWLPRPAPYLDVWRAMHDYTESRDEQSPDVIWLVEHEPVYTLGQAGKPEHILNSGSIPVVHTNRGGQVTYHGPGQVIAYCLIDLHRAGLFVKEYVALLEDVTIELLTDMGVAGVCLKPGAPGVYVPMADRGGELAKIAALGIKVRHGRAYHGIALNVAMDLSPFLGINPCGYAGLRTVDMATCGVHVSMEQVGEQLAQRLAQGLSAKVAAKSL
ncbi:MAG: lipoyl(octanoyl) transferase LipB [Burkholderiaceae bacterium]|nr:MAG: lipoyl(octanoyl) transferase LipB [Burkholderiaceae bacterium]TAM06054.1 MAG: lipoyl(octanoyl) transferase LipB [Pusillimonas sp.]